MARLVAALITLPLASVVVIAVGVRLLAGVALPASSTDSHEFGLLARNIVEGRGYTYYQDDPRGRVEPDRRGVTGERFRKVGLLLGADLYHSRNLNPLYLGPYLALAVSGTLGAVGCWRRRPEGDPVRWLVAGYAGFAVAVPFVFFVLARYRLPLEALPLIFAAYAVARLADMAARSPRPQTAEVAA